MESTVVKSDKIQTWRPKRPNEVDVFRYQKWLDGEGKLWLVVLTFGHDNKGRFGNMIELLDMDREATIDMTRADFEQMVLRGDLRRLEGPVFA